MEIIILNSISEIEEIWREGTLKNGGGTPFQHPLWLQAWSEAHEIPVRAAWIKGELLLPFVFVNKLGFQVLEVAGGKGADYHLPLLQSQNLNWLKVLQALRQKIEFDLFWCERVPGNWLGLAPSILNLPHFPFWENCHQAHLTGDFEKIQSERMPKKLISDSQRQWRRLQELGTVKVMRPQSKSEALHFLQGLIEQKRKQYQQQGKKLIFDEPTELKFYRRFTELAWNHAEGILDISALVVGETPVAFHWGLKAPDRYYYLLPSYENEHWGKYSPARLHLLELLKEACEKGCALFDFTVGDEPYKKHWCDVETPLYQVYWCANPLAQGVVQSEKFKNQLRKWGVPQRLRQMRARYTHAQESP